MYSDISIKTAIVLNAIAILSNLYLCFISSGHHRYIQFSSISIQCRWLGLLYLVLAWFMGDGTAMNQGVDPYSLVAKWMTVFSIGWIVVFVISLLSTLWCRGDKLSSKTLGISLLYLIIGFLIH